MFHSAFEVCRHHAHGDSAVVLIRSAADSCNVNRPGRVQRGQHAVVPSTEWRVHALVDLLLDYALRNSMPAQNVRKSMWVVLSLKLGFLN